MDLETLFSMIQEAGQIAPSRRATIRTSIKYYAQALGCRSAKDCSEEIYALDKLARNSMLEKHLTNSSAHVLRNTKNDISFILRHAERLKLIRPISQAGHEIAPPIFGKRRMGQVLPSLISAQDTGFHRTPYSLALEQWPVPLRDQYDEWKEWVEKDEEKVEGINPFNRPATIENKTRKFEAFFGYVFNIRSIDDLDFQMLLDVGPEGLASSKESNFVSWRQQPRVGLLEEFVSWHRTRHHGKTSAQVRELLSVAISVAWKYYYPKALLAEQQPEAEKFRLIAESINRLRHHLKYTFKVSGPLLSRGLPTVSTEDLLRAAQAEFPSESHVLASQPGTVMASIAGRALAVMLLVHYPLRNRNYREARRSQNIIKKDDGSWVLRFTGSQPEAGLKSKRRLNKPNVYEVVMNPEVTGYLERYLDHWRPKLIGQIEDQIEELRVANNVDNTQVEELETFKDFLFLSSKGVPYSRLGFSQWVQGVTYRWLGVRVNPELIRRIAATELLRKTDDLQQVAELLNDVPESVLKMTMKG